LEEAASEKLGEGAAIGREDKRAEDASAGFQRFSEAGDHA
jgi:hypothetical protein